MYDCSPELGQRLSRVRANTVIDGAATAVQDDSFVYDALGDPTQIHDAVVGQEHYQCFGYDGAVRLQRAYTAASACTGGPGYSSNAWWRDYG